MEIEKQVCVIQVPCGKEFIVLGYSASSESVL